MQNCSKIFFQAVLGLPNRLLAAYHLAGWSNRTARSGIRFRRIGLGLFCPVVS